MWTKNLVALRVKNEVVFHIFMDMKAIFVLGILRAPKRRSPFFDVVFLANFCFFCGCGYLRPAGRVNPVYLALRKAKIISKILAKKGLLDYPERRKDMKNKTQNKQKNLKQGFTLLEMLVVVLIIGILASIALPQYQMAVTKAKVASILPLMRRWKDAYAEYKLQHDSYMTEEGDYPDGDTLGVNWPSNWDCDGSGMECWNDYWYCFANEEGTGIIYCKHEIDDNNEFVIKIYQPDELTHEDFAGMITCDAWGTAGHSVCKALGGELVDGYNLTYQLY